jgi:surfeit locus 1 family protein
MIPRLPLIPTILVAFAVAAMIGLGIWQLRRADEKEALLDQYRAAQGMSPIAWPTVPPDNLPLFRRAHGFCLQPITRRATAGRNRSDETGYVHVVHCRTGAEGPGMAVEVGWSKDPQAPVRWGGGAVTGVIVPDSRYRMRLVADRAPPGLEPSAVPGIESIPNNHLLYAVQWFLFALIAVVIYTLALRKRLKDADKAAVK